MIKVTWEKEENNNPKSKTLLIGHGYLVPRKDDGAAEDECVAHGEVCGPDDQAQ